MLHSETLQRSHPNESAPPLEGILKRVFGFESFRPYQKAVCESAVRGEDLLLVMPTGAGKSLCYQIPGLARRGQTQGTTLVISPLVALMDDQALKLQQLGLKAERIHAGRDRASSRQACIDYLSGRLDFLLVAPERLAIPGFLEMLAKRTPALITIDEAHCISQWGHDFRPEYRMLGERLPLLRPAPVMALTATATPRVQDDIVKQLGLQNAHRFIHGFRRTNIAIEVVELNPSERAGAVLKLLDEKSSRPAIVYAPTRKEAEELALKLKKKIPAAAYHAGLPAETREKIQGEFLSGKLEAIVATIAFGMGIDKPDVRTVVHTALPGSVEGYYQEIGRAGRDGKMSRAVLLYSYADRRTHEFFQNRDYPEVSELKKIYNAAPTPAIAEKKPLPVTELQQKLKLDTETIERQIQKLRIHGGITVDAEGCLIKGKPDWDVRYSAQRDHRASQLEHVTRYASARRCRMLELISHFGDTEEATPCGHCDACAPDDSTLKRLREPTPREQSAMRAILDELLEQDNLATGRLFQNALADSSIDRKGFEHILSGLVRAGWVKLKSDSFEKDGRVIEYSRASITRDGVQALGNGIKGDSLSKAVLSETEAFGLPKAKKRKRATVIRRRSE